MTRSFNLLPHMSNGYRTNEKCKNKKKIFFHVSYPLRKACQLSGMAKQSLDTLFHTSPPPHSHTPLPNKLGNLNYLVDLGHESGKGTNALKLYQAQDQEEEPAQITTVVLAMEDCEAEDGLTLERPVTPQPSVTPFKLRGINTQSKDYNSK